MALITSISPRTCARSPLSSFFRTGEPCRSAEYRLRHVDAFSGSEALFYIMVKTARARRCFRAKHSAFHP